MANENKNQLIKNYLLNKIRSNELKPFDVIESENELTKKFDVSRMTTRKALDELVTKGYLFREQGKGTFVANRADNGRNFMSLSESALMRGYTVTNKIITYYKDEPTPEVMTHLKVRKHKQILYIQRLRIVDDEPYAYESSGFVASIFGECNDEILKNSIYNHLERNRKIIIVLANQEIESVPANEVLASWLNVPQGTPLLKISTISIMRNGIPFEYTVTYYRSDRYKITQTAFR